MKAGYYYHKTNSDERCFFLTGEKKGNKWIYIGGTGGEIPDQFYYLKDACWMSLIWTCLPSEEELKEYTYSETNPTNFELSFPLYTKKEISITQMKELVQMGITALDDYQKLKVGKKYSVYAEHKDSCKNPCYDVVCTQDCPIAIRRI